MRSLLLALLLLGVACPPVPEAPVPDVTLDAGPLDAGPLDAGPLDAGPPVFDYRHLPFDGSVPASLVGEVWKRHWTEDLKPFWDMPEALGTPAGNYPTYRTMRGLPASNTERHPRMMGRQVFTHAMGFALTGDTAQLEKARAGVEWLRTRAKDPRGGYFARLDASGNGIDGDKYSQDLSYVMLGYAAWYFVTRDPLAEAELLAGRDLLFDPALYWDAANGRIKDGLTPDLTVEADQNNDLGWELVAPLDAVNGFLNLVQPVLSEPSRRAQVADDLRTLGTFMVKHFRDAETGIFWGTTTRKSYGQRHVDWGHTLKTYWMLLQIDKKLPDHPFQRLVLENAPRLLARAYDAPNGRWSKAPTSPTDVSYGNDWWIAAELDQLAATLHLLQRADLTPLATTAGHWESDWVDSRVGELIPAVNRLGARAFAWPDNDTAKCNLWKSGFHSTEHALVLYLFGRDLEGQPAELHFAVPPAQVESFIATPYVFSGRVTARQPLADVTVGGRALKVVKVSFDRLF